MFWGNYRLIFEERNQADIVTFPFFTANGGMNISGFEKALTNAPGDKVAFVLNFPNNPTGYTPTARDGERIIELLLKLAESGKYDFVFYGHNHKPWIEEIGETFLANPGTLAGLFNKATFAILDTENKKLELKILERV